MLIEHAPIVGHKDCRNMSFLYFMTTALQITEEKHIVCQKMDINKVPKTACPTEAIHRKYQPNSVTKYKPEHKRHPQQAPSDKFPTGTADNCCAN